MITGAVAMAQMAWWMNAAHHRFLSIGVSEKAFK